MMKNTLKRIVLGASFTLLALSTVSAQTYTPAPENLQARKEFQDNKFGIFLHWGIYSMTARGEWYMNDRNIHRDEYAKLASGFYPSKFNAAEWVSQIKASGAKYITITSRHHDSFSMFDTKESDYDIVDATPFKRDVLKELADECQKQGIKLHFYYSHLDWKREDYPLGRTGKGTGRPKGKENWQTYYQFMNNQLTELLTNYGPIGAIWFDGVWDQPESFDWQLEEQYALIHKLHDTHLTTVIGIDGSRSIQHTNALLDGQTTARTNLRFKALRQGHINTGRNQTTLQRLQGNRLIQIGTKVHACRLLGSILRQRMLRLIDDLYFHDFLKN